MPMESLLLRLPAEILKRILGFLSPGDLCVLCQVAKALQPLAEAGLYSEIRWKWNFEALDKLDHPIASRVPPIIPFLRTILQRPELALLVRALDLDGSDFRVLWLLTFKPRGLSVTDADVDPLISIVESLDISQYDRTSWIHELRQGTMDAFVAVLLLRLRHLEQLRLDENFLRHSRFFGIVLRWAVYSPVERCVFRDLAEVHCQLEERTVYRITSKNLGDVLPLFYLPSIQHISVSFDSPAGLIEWPLGHPPKPLSLDSLDITMLRERHLGQVLSVTPMLRELRWTWYFVPELKNQFMTNVIDLDLIIADLFHVRNTLKDLSIKAWTRNIWDMGQHKPSVSIQGSFIRLADFHVLRKLAIPLTFLTGSMTIKGSQTLERCLPRCLEILTISDSFSDQSGYEWNDSHPLDAMREWLTRYKEYTPGIRLLHLHTKKTDFADWTRASILELEEITSRIRVDLILTREVRTGDKPEWIYFDTRKDISQYLDHLHGYLPLHPWGTLKLPILL